MNLDLLKKKLAGLQNNSSKGSGEKKDYSLIYWKAPIGKAQIRIVPSKLNPEYPYEEVQFHYGIGNKVMISPLSFGEKDPIAEFAELLRSQEYDKDRYKLSKKLDPKMRYFAPVIVRGEEEKGVRLWQFGKLIWEELVKLSLDDEIGDFTNIVEGRDLTVETTSPEENGTDYNKSTVRVRLKTSPLSEDAEQVDKWLKEQPVAKEQYKRFTYDEMKAALEKWLDPKDEDLGDAEEEDVIPKAPSKYSADTSKSKQRKEDKFDAIFDEDKDSKSFLDDDDDDVPF